MRIFFWYFIFVKICVDFFLIRFYFSFQIFIIEFRFTVKLIFWYYLQFFPQVLLYCTNNSASFVNKDIFIVSSVSSIKALLFEKICIKFYFFFNIFVANEIFKPIFVKTDFIRYYCFVIIYMFIEIGLLFWWNFCFSILLSQNFVIFFPFLYII